MATENDPFTSTAPVHVLEPTQPLVPPSTSSPPAITAQPTTTMAQAEPPQALPAPTAAPVSAEATLTEKPSKVEAEEPQNSLTKQFTKEEWAALKQFKEAIPSIFAESYPENPTASTDPITLWGIKIDPQNLNSDARVSVVLMKFLRARNLSVTEGREMMVNTLRWRAQFDVDAALKEEFPQDIFGQLGHVFGHDKGGRPVVYNLYGANQDLNAVFGDVERFLRWRVAFMERSVSALDFTEIDQTLQVHDYEGVGLTSRDANSKRAASEATNIFQSHYPEFLYKKFFINVPTILNWIFWIFKPLMSAKTLAKMSVVGTGQHAISKALLPIIDAKELPKRYGGEADAF